MNTALELFAEKGFTNTSISLIASTAKISKGLLYNYFESKEDLLMEIFDDGLSDMISLFDKNKDGELSREEFIFFINQSFDLMVADIKFWKLYFSLIMQPSVMTLFEKRLHSVLTPLMNILIEYYRKKGDKDPQGSALLAGAVMDGIGFHFVLNPDIYPIDKIKKMIIEKFV
jgi:AcrR family transcriptional regulator